MDDVFRRNSSRHVADFFVVVGMKFDNLLQTCIEMSRMSPFQTDSFDNAESSGATVNVNLLQTAFEASVLSRYPTIDVVPPSSSHSQPNASKLPEGIEYFCFPEGLILSKNAAKPKFHAFVHTSEDGSRMVGTCLTFSEELTEEEYEVISQIEEHLHHSKSNSSEDGSEIARKFNSSSSKLYISKAVCILSYWPFIDPFKKFLMILYNMIGSEKVHKIPIERFICNFIDDIPAPPAGKVDIMYYVNDDAISFKCPPLNVPSTWLSFPLLPLFQCLSLNNIMLLFSAVLTERQILFISSQYSLLTICAESIISLLYPLTWSHAYIPVLPSRLLGVLGAPFPFLLGLPSAIYEKNKSAVSGETVRVFLDIDSIDLGILGPPPPLPDHRKQKLITHLETTIPWYSSVVSNNIEKKKAYFRRNREIIRHYDEVFPPNNKVKTTNSQSSDSSNSNTSTSRNSSSVYSVYSVSNKVHNNYFTQHKSGGTSSTVNVQTIPIQEDVSEISIREGFLKFFLNMLKYYKKFLVYNRDESDPHKKFHYTEFMNSHPAEWYPLLKELMNAQCFQQFVDERVLLSKLNRDVVFFDEAIDAKLNRYTFKLRELDTPFLYCSDEHIKSYVPPTPCHTQLDAEGYSYSFFPILREDLYIAPRQLAAKFAPATDQLLGMLSRLRLKRKKVVKTNSSRDSFGLESSAHNASQLSIASCIFSCYLVIVSQLISNSIEVMNSMNNKNSIFSTKHMLDIYGNSDNITENNSFVRRMSISDQKDSSPSQFNNSGSAHTSQIMVNSSGVMKSYDNKANEVFSSATVALQVCFEVLNALIKLDYAPDEIVYRYLAEACADLGDADRLLDLAVFMDSEGLVPDHQIRHSLVRSLINCSHRHVFSKNHNGSTKSSGLKNDMKLRLQPSEAWSYVNWSSLRRAESSLIFREQIKTADGKDVNSSTYLTKMLFNLSVAENSNVASSNNSINKLPPKPPAASPPALNLSKAAMGISSNSSSAQGSPVPNESVSSPKAARDKWSEDPNEGYVPTLTWSLKETTIVLNEMEKAPGAGKLLSPVNYFAVSKRLHRLVIVSEKKLAETFPELCVDLNNKFGMTCPNDQCVTRTQSSGSPSAAQGRVLTIGEVHRGWTKSSMGNNNMNNYTTSCIFCGTAFIPRFSVTYHNHSEFWCEFLSPWTLYKETLNILFEEGVLTLLNSDFANRSYQSAVVFWNLLVSFRLRGFPLAFLCGKLNLVDAFPAAPKSNAANDK